MPPRSDKPRTSAKPSPKRSAHTPAPAKARAAKPRPSFAAAAPASIKPTAGWVYRSEASAARSTADTPAAHVDIAAVSVARPSDRVVSEARLPGRIERGVNVVTMPLSLGVLTVFAQWNWLFNMRRPR